MKIQTADTPVVPQIVKRTERRYINIADTFFRR